MLADLGAERLQTLTAIASFANEKGECWPKQSTLAQALGVTRETVNKRIKALADYRWNGRPVIVKMRKGRRTIYMLTEVSPIVFRTCDANTTSDVMYTTH